jgi:nucleoside phosphorylase
MNCPTIFPATRHHLCGLVDVAVITGLEVEQLAVLDALGLAETRIEQLSRDVQFIYGKLHNERTQRVLGIAVFCTRQDGNTYMAGLTSLIHALLLPRLAVLLGICAGLQSSTSAAGPAIKGVRIGAVLVPKNIADFSFGVLTRHEDIKHVMPRYKLHRVGATADRLLSDDDKQMACRIRDAYLTKQYPKWGTTDFAFRTPDDQTLKHWNQFLGGHVEVKEIPISDHMIASSNWLLRDQDVLVDLYHHDERIRGADMESAGFAEASLQCQAECIVVRGVSDVGTAKGDEFQHLASANAAAYLGVFLRNKLDPASLNDNAANLRRFREERAERQIKAVLEAFASLLQDKFALPMNLEIYWVGRHRYVVSGEWERGVLRDGHLRAERAGALNRFEPRRFFAFLPKSLSQ